MTDVHLSAPGALLLQALRRVVLTAQMTWAYQGRFPRRKMWSLYWQQSEGMIRRG